MKVPAFLTEKPPRFWYTVMFCYAFILPFFFIGIYITLNQVYEKITISSDVMAFMVNGLNYAFLLSIVFIIYAGFGWIEDRVFLAIKTGIGWLINLPGRMLP